MCLIHLNNRAAHPSDSVKQSRADMYRPYTVAQMQTTNVPNALLTEMQQAAQVILEVSSTLKEGSVASMIDAIKIREAQEATLRKVISIRQSAATSNVNNQTTVYREIHTRSIPVPNRPPQIDEGNMSQEETTPEYSGEDADSTADISKYLMITHFALSTS
ncbi:hypothetical protein R1sor_019116 [Riccia sorocarpa]|uniref:Uncharacterized protein n=1 Tax=Riccia sorocarpa TaxID=122646 RepID=A0ABD3IDC2_9MARC